MTVLLYELKADLAAYCAARVPDPRRRDIPVVRTLADAIAFNEAHRKEEMPFFGQELFLQAQEKGPLTDRSTSTRWRQAAAWRSGGIDAVLDGFSSTPWSRPPEAAWPTIRSTVTTSWSEFLSRGDRRLPARYVPAGICLGLPVGLTFMGAPERAGVAPPGYAYEQASRNAGRRGFWPRWRSTDLEPPDGGRGATGLSGGGRTTRTERTVGSDLP